MKPIADTWGSSKVQQLQAGFVETFAYVGLGFGPRWQVATPSGTLLRSPPMATTLNLTNSKRGALQNA